MMHDMLRVIITFTAMNTYVIYEWNPYVIYVGRTKEILIKIKTPS